MADQVPAQEPSIVERMMAFVEAQDDAPPQDPPENAPVETAPEQTQAEPQPEETPEANPEETTDEDSPEGPKVEGEEASAETGPTFKLKHHGVEIEKSQAEVIELAHAGLDYTVKTQQLADERKSFEQQAQSLKAEQQAFAEQMQLQQSLTGEIANVTAIDSQLSQYQNIDWQALTNTDPVEAQKLFIAYTQLKTQREELASGVQRKYQQITQQQQQARAKQLAEAQQQLAKELPGWGPELAKHLVATGKEFGFTDGELSNLTDPRAVKLLHAASQWRKFQAAKTATEKKVAAAPPVVKPGAKQSNNAANANIRQQRELLSKTGKAEHAAKLIENML